VVVVRAAGSTYGNAFRVTTFGESHGKGVGCVVDGVPPRLAITTEEIQLELDRRRPGQSIITTPRKEEDTCEILSGVFDGVTLGTPIAVLVRNKDQRSNDYSEMSVAYRPSHADATYDFKYGIRAIAGGGRSSARETIGRVAAGAIAKKLLHVVGGTEVRAVVDGGIQSQLPGLGCEGSTVWRPVLWLQWACTIHCLHYSPPLPFWEDTQLERLPGGLCVPLSPQPLCVGRVTCCICNTLPPFPPTTPWLLCPAGAGIREPGP
jgi:hypothetical protein